MKGFKRLAVLLLSAIMIFGSGFSLASCDVLSSVLSNSSSNSDSGNSSSSNENYKLATPVIKTKSDTSVSWDIVSHADHYLVWILPNDVQIETKTPSIALEDYFAGRTQLDIYVQAIAAEGSNYNDSEWSEVYTFTINTEMSTEEKGVGSAVNLLMGGYAEFATGTTSIFDKTLFNQLALNEDVQQNASGVYRAEESLSDYLNKLEADVGVKIKNSASGKIPKVGTISAGYEFNVNVNYQKNSQFSTSSIFYDLNYYYTRKIVEIDGYNNTQKLSNCLSEEFKTDAKNVKNQTDAAEFIEKYGTHIVTAGVYGAKFNAHYELITSKEVTKNSTKVELESAINAGFKSSITGLNIEGSNEFNSSLDLSSIEEKSEEERQIEFWIKGVGGKDVPEMATSLEDFAEVCNKWVEGLNDENSVLIDVPDDSLYCVWDYLDDSYAETKDVLNEYFYSQCENYYVKVKNKANDIYADVVDFETETGVLTVNFAGLSDLSKVSYQVDKHGVDFNENLTLKNNNETYAYENQNYLFTVYPKINFIPVKKVVFKGSYMTEDGKGDAIETKFDNLSIQFKDTWKDDIFIEFDHFGYSAKAGMTALDFSAVQSQNIKINVVGNAYIKGGDGVFDGADGCVGINAAGKNLTITGDNLDVFGGNGVLGSSSVGNGGGGGNGIQAQSITVELSNNALMNVSGGNGAAAYNRGTGENNGDGSNGRDGYTGGAGGIAIKAVNVTVNSGLLTAMGGNGGEGGDGSECNYRWGATVKGGNGGNGGNGATAIEASSLTVSEVAEGISIELIGGNGGKTGRKGGCHNGDTSGIGGGASDGNDGIAGSGGLAISSNCIIKDSLNIVVRKNGSKGTIDTDVNWC